MQSERGRLSRSRGEKRAASNFAERSRPPKVSANAPVEAVTTPLRHRLANAAAVEPAALRICMDTAEHGGGCRRSCGAAGTSRRASRQKLGGSRHLAADGGVEFTAGAHKSVARAGGLVASFP